MTRHILESTPASRATVRGDTRPDILGAHEAVRGYDLHGQPDTTRGVVYTDVGDIKVYCDHDGRWYGWLETKAAPAFQLRSPDLGAVLRAIIATRQEELDR